MRLVVLVHNRPARRKYSVHRFDNPLDLRLVPDRARQNTSERQQVTIHRSVWSTLQVLHGLFKLGIGEIRVSNTLAQSRQGGRELGVLRADLLQKLDKVWDITPKV